MELGLSKLSGNVNFGVN